MGIEIRPTRIHRLLNSEPGSVPNWICSNKSLSLADLLPELILTAGLAASSALALIVGFWILPLVIATLIIAPLVRRETRELKLVERKCRARIRRHECLYCGVRLEETDTLSCPACEHKDFLTRTFR